MGTRRAALAATVGTHRAFRGGGSGTGLFGHAGLAFVLRKREGFNLVAGGGLSTPFNDSPRRPGPCDDLALSDRFCHDYRAGEWGLWASFQAGMSL